MLMTVKLFTSPILSLLAPEPMASHFLSQWSHVGIEENQYGSLQERAIGEEEQLPSPLPEFC